MRMIGGLDKQIITIESDACARRHGLDKARVYNVFLRLAEIGWITPNFPRKTVFDEALAFLSPKKALELFEKSDLIDLANHKLLVDYLSDAPFYTLNEFSEVIAAFIKYLQCNRDSLIKIGYPQTSFVRFSWLNWNLANLYYVKIPVAIQDNRSPYRQRVWEEDGLAEHDEEGNLIYSFSWSPVLISDKVEIELKSEFGDKIFLFSLPGYGWTKSGPITKDLTLEEFLYLIGKPPTEFINFRPP